ncbi:MAG: hypothetical protein HZB79_08850 [Deltaproteobacteria bacterium]|nr:hypothetical protein [Deltaproteobacteria bacterium]
MCHKYSGMGRYEKGSEGTAKKRVYYIPEVIFKNTVHGKLRCKDCHIKVDKIPHTDVERVDCSTNCHIKDPSSGVEFSHKRIVETFNKSVHGIEGTKNPKHKNDLPTCLSCHTNPIISLSSDKHLGFLNICTQCHEKKEWAERFLKHQFYRMGQRRSSKDIVALCGGCHENRRIMDRHKLDVVVGFKDTFHGKAIKYGFGEVANCLSCHAPRVLGFNPHNILPKTDNNSPVNEASRLKTCQNSGGVDSCHPTATREFALGMKKVHPSGITPSFTVEDNADAAASGEASKHEADDIFRRNVIYWINTGYKVVIGFVVGGMVVHQILDFRAAARERRRERKRGGAHGQSH